MISSFRYYIKKEILYFVLTVVPYCLLAKTFIIEFCFKISMKILTHINDYIWKNNYSLLSDLGA